MIASLSSRSLTTILAMATVAAALTLTPQTMAQAGKAACSSSATTHSKRGAHACVQSKRPSKSFHKSKARPHSKAKGHHAKHGVKHAATKTATRAKAPAGTSLPAATCEDASAPVRASDGSFSCGDESEPGCSDGSTPALSSDGSTLVCSAGSSGGSPTSAASCEDRSAPVRAGDGSFSCDDESEPGCENGSAPMLTSDRSTLICNVATVSTGPSRNF